MEALISLKDIVHHQGHQGVSFCLRIDQLDLLPQRIYALTGPNGAGKSTLLRMLAQLLVPQQGRITFQGEMNSDTQQNRQVTLVEQSPYLLYGSVSYNIAYGLKLRGIRGREQQQRIDDALAMVGLSAFAKRSVRQLSGGECQRVALARALALQPQLLLLDEPTSNIDSKSLESFESLISALPERGVTVVLSTHDPGQPQRLGAIELRLDDGLLAQNPHGEQRQSQITTMEQQLCL